MYILGISNAHNATATLLRDGHIVGCVSEERFKRIKNYSGYAQESIAYLLKFAEITPQQLDLVVLAYETSPPISPGINHDFMSFLYAITSKVKEFWMKLEFHFSPFRPIGKFFYILIINLTAKRVILREKRLISQKLNIPEDKIVTLEHHAAHAYAAYYASPYSRRKTLLFTLDGEGDKLCATVNIAEREEIRRIAQTYLGDSLGWIYMAVTKYLGMKSLEDEYKVMGLAPYAKKDNIQITYEAIKDIIRLDEKNPLVFKSTFDTHMAEYFFKKRLYGHRFDNVAGAVQKLTEDVVTDWVVKAVKETGICTVVLGGGVFMNVKLNLKIMESPQIKELYVLPSCGDESTPLGACYWGYQYLCNSTKLKFNPQPLKDLYLGPASHEKEILQAIEVVETRKKYVVRRYEEIEPVIARLLSENKIVANFAGRMEWGARALGNRSILANPSDRDNLRILNELIKDRDFWMPFTPSILKERQNDYLINPKGVSAYYMIIAFHSTDKAKKDLIAALHPYDFTVRPQVVQEDWNPRYYRILKEFERLTGIGGILNTSFNIHGEPMVCSPSDAINAFERSGLEYLIIENYLISKR